MQFERWTLLIAAVPVVVFIAANQLFYAYANPMPPSFAPVFDAHSVTIEAARRVRFLAVLTLFLAISTTTVAFFLVELFRSHRYARDVRRDVLVAAAVILAIAAVYGYAESDRRLHERLGGDLYEAVLAVCAQGSPAAAATCLFGEAEPDGTPSGFDFMLLVGASGALSSVLASALGSVLALTQSKGTLVGQTPDVVFRLPRLFLYLASASFTMAMVCVITWLNMVVPFLPPDGPREAFGELRDAVVLFYGIVYSLMVLAFFVPVLVILTARYQAAHAQGPLPEGGGTVTLSRAAKDGFAFLAPILTALVSSGGAALFDQLALVGGG